MNHSWRKKIYNVIECNRLSVYSRIYDWFMLVIILISIVPLAFRQNHIVFEVFDKISVSVFIVDYLLRWLTADYRMPKRAKWQAFIIYPFTGLAIIDLLSILPSFVAFNRAFKLFRIRRLLKIVRIFKLVRYSKNIQILVRVMQKEKSILFTVFLIAVTYIVLTALIMFNTEDSVMFENFFDALYWATTTLTTVGYGDIYPSTELGRAISMLSAIFGVAIIALPSGVITASYLEELRLEKKKKL